jgi:hypothetical protein
MLTFFNSDMIYRVLWPNVSTWGMSRYKGKTEITFRLEFWVAWMTLLWMKEAKQLSMEGIAHEIKGEGSDYYGRR